MLLEKIEEGDTIVQPHLKIDHVIEVSDLEEEENLLKLKFWAFLVGYVMNNPVDSIDGHEDNQHDGGGQEQGVLPALRVQAEELEFARDLEAGRGQLHGLLAPARKEGASHLIK